MKSVLPILLLLVSGCGGASHGPCACPAVFDPVCGVDGMTYGNTCEASCARANVACTGACPCSSPGTCGDGICGVGESCLNCAPDCGPCAPGCGECRSDAECAAGTSCDLSGCLASCECPSCAVCAGHCAPCACPEYYFPVCGTDGVTYGNPCEAGCARVAVACNGTCPCISECGECASDTDCATGQLCSVATMCLPSCACPACTVCTGHCEPCACPRNWDPVCGVDGVTYGNSCGAACAHVGVACAGVCPCGGIDCSTDPTLCPAGQGCACGGPGPVSHCECGLLCTADTDCTDPAQPVCCAGTCTDACTCYCD